MKEEIRNDYSNLMEANTPDWLRSFEGCTQYTDGEAIQILNSLDILAHILLLAGEHSCNNKRTITIPLPVHSNKKAA